MGLVIFLICLLTGLQLLDYNHKRKYKHIELTEACPPPDIEETDIVFKGKKLKLGDTDLHRILYKRCPYYRLLHTEKQPQFLKRLKSFMRKKTFIIKDDEGLREMPVLVSAAAIQLTFGLKRYLLPFYRYIRIYPEEYFADHSFKVLAGNVQNNIITVAWNHLLKGNENATDGSNLGLHEMSHALYIQKMVVEGHYAKDFSKQYGYLMNECHEAYKTEAAGRKDLYSAYADTNLQEFWAESVELFFEKPIEMNAHYPEVFEGMKLLLNQDPRNGSDPVLHSSLSFNEKLHRIRALATKRLLRGTEG